MKLKPLQAVEVYSTLQPLALQPLSFKSSYRIGRNLDHLQKIFDKFMEDFKKETASGIDPKQADFNVAEKWALLTEEEEFPLMILELENEPDLKISAHGIKKLSPILPSTDAT